jgi:hypothetical protein
MLRIVVFLALSGCSVAGAGAKGFVDGYNQETQRQQQAQGSGNRSHGGSCKNDLDCNPGSSCVKSRSNQYGTGLCIQD